ncbi:MAG TPA: hypothetical protein VGE37_15290, partial [Archangium sp.]
MLEPSELDLGRVYVGQTKQRTATVRNGGRAATVVSLENAAPFSVSPAELSLPGGGQAEITVSLMATEPGAPSASLKVGAVVGVVRAEVLEAPRCTPSSPCRSAQFDESTGVCVERELAEGAACETSCLSAGRCAGGDCVGEAAS